MGKLKKGICCLLSALMMVSVCLMTRPQEIKADISESVWQNYNGEIVFYDEPSECFIYQTMDVKKTSSVFYRTIGIEFSRIKKVRFWDLRRWGLATTVLNGTHMEGVKPTKVGDGYEYNVVDCDAGKTRVYLEKYNRFPIPIAEIQQNPACEQFDEWK